jgi:glycine hydroxymethyltransferase
MHVIAAKAVAFYEALQPEFKVYSAQVDRQRARDDPGAAGSAASRSSRAAPTITCSWWIWSTRTSPGKEADASLGRAHITVNKNAVPNDPRPPMVTSGLRIGTPAVTTRGFKEPEVAQLSHWIADVLDHLGDESVVERVRGQVMTLCRRFPVYSWQS